MQPGLYFVEWMIKAHQQELLREAERRRQFGSRGPRHSLHRYFLGLLGRRLTAWGEALERRSRPRTAAPRRLG
jgi:hypothetical protein